MWEALSYAKSVFIKFLNSYCVLLGSYSEHDSIQ